VQLSFAEVAIILINMLPCEIFIYLYVAVGSYLEYLRDLETKIDQDWDSISSSLEEMRKSLFSKNGCLINLTSDGKNLEKSRQHIAKFLDSLPSSPSIGSDPWLSRLPSVNEAIVVPTQVTTSCLNTFRNHGEITTH
jgi:Zn-dependent M16 (insulinase) family peptidase